MNNYKKTAVCDFIIDLINEGAYFEDNWKDLSNSLVYDEDDDEEVKKEIEKIKSMNEWELKSLCSEIFRSRINNIKFDNDTDHENVLRFILDLFEEDALLENNYDDFSVELGYPGMNEEKLREIFYKYSFF